MKPTLYSTQAALTLLLAACAARASDDMLIYGDFTNVVYGTLTYNNGWQDWGWVPHYFTNNPDLGTTNSIVFAANNNYQALYLEHDPIDTTIYSNITFWVNGGSVGGQYVGLQAIGSASNPRLAFTAPTNAWQRFTVPLSSLGAANATNLTGFQFWNGPTLQSNFYLAGISLVAAPAPAVVHVGVNAAAAVRSVDPRWFSVNTAAWDGDLDTPSSVSVLTAINNQALRWPGGSWGDIYHFTNEYAAFQARNYGCVTTNFIHVATNTHAQIYFIANYGSATTNEAVDWVNFCNKTNNCYVKYWEIGNENFGGWEEDINTNLAYFGQEVPHDPWTYAMRFKDYYHAMKAVDPTIKIGAVVLPDAVSYANNTNHPALDPVTGITNYGWTAVMLYTMHTNGVTPDFLIYHKYAPSDGDTYNLLWTRTFSSDAASLRQVANDYLGSVATNIEFVITEFGPEADRQWISLVGGLIWADSIGQIMQTEFNTLLWWDLRNSFDPASLPPPIWPAAAEAWRKTPLLGGRQMLLTSHKVVAPNGAGYLIETGAPMDEVQADLRHWLTFLAAGLPGEMILALAGGYVLVKRALAPVERIAASAERISSSNLSERLPAPPTGDELEHLTLALNHMIQRLDEAFQYSRRFVADASHELRTPLTVLRGELESFVQDPRLAPERREQLGSVLEEVERLAQIVEGLFAISRLDAGEAQAEWVRFDLAQLASATADQMSLLAEDKKIQLSCASDSGVWVKGDRSRLKQVVVNLLDNAIKYTPPEGKVALEVKAVNGHAVLEVADTGIGIPAEALPRIFDRFFRVDKARSREQGGAGLGLSIVKAICAAHYGRVEAASAPGQGTRFRVELPLAQNHSLSDRRTSA